MRIYERMMFMLSIAIICGEIGFVAYENHRKAHQSGESSISDVTSIFEDTRRRLNAEEEDGLEIKTCPDDKLNRKRFIKCSSMQVCYDKESRTYENDMCERGNELCSYFIVQVFGERKIFSGCLLSKYCNHKGYYKDSPVLFRCNIPKVGPPP